MGCSERLMRKLQQTLKAFSKLVEVKFLKEKLDEEILYEVSAKRFEYTFEALWKTIRLFLLEEKGIECNSPMDCFKSFYAVGLLSEEKGKLIPKVVRKRNEVVHIYDFETAEEVYRFVVEEVVPLFGEILESLTRECVKANF